MTDRPEEEAETRRPELSVTQLAAGGFATVAAAVAASRLGVAGTLGGAAFMSVVSTAGSVWIRHYLDRGREHVLRPVVLREERLATPDPNAPAPKHPARDPAATRLDLTRVDLEPAAVTRVDEIPAYRPRESAPAGRRWRPTWKAAAVSAALLFAVAVGGIAAAEALTHKPAASWTGGGGSGKGFFTHSSTSPAPEPARRTATPSATATTAPAPSETPATRPAEPSATPVPTTSAPEPTPSQSQVTEAPTDQVTP